MKTFDSVPDVKVGNVSATSDRIKWIRICSETSSCESCCEGTSWARERKKKKTPKRGRRNRNRLNKTEPVIQEAPEAREEPILQPQTFHTVPTTVGTSPASGTTDTTESAATPDAALKL
ncbi:unnamed protein product [Pleuronectes platessa]|uniref:Uncharacterized protein n=1 Tax=Pleuronectes platessa TaxID=8262 RepID=A0A9N7Y8V9_PLEPL|nr:unnamed protein product [Pleuronectes platessa]